MLYEEFERRIRTEELKGWYSTPDSGELFQGTSVSSLVVPSVFENSLAIKNIDMLENLIAEQYIKAHDRNALTLQSAIVDPVEKWIHQGLYYGVVLPSKVIAQAFNLVVDIESTS